MVFLLANSSSTPLLLGLLFLADKSISLGEDTLLSSFAGSLGLGTLGVHFFLEGTLTLLLGLGLVDLIGLVNITCSFVDGKTNLDSRVQREHACA
jgi:hypothetical protein